MDNVKTVYCHHCGMVRENPSLPKCPGCGTLFVKVCSRCGAPVKKDRENCIKCGLSIDKMVVPMPGMRVVSESEQISKAIACPDNNNVKKNKHHHKRNSAKLLTVITAIWLLILSSLYFIPKWLTPDYVEAMRNGDYKSAYYEAKSEETKNEIAWVNLMSYIAKEYVSSRLYEININEREVTAAYYCGDWSNECAILLMYDGDFHDNVLVEINSVANGDDTSDNYQFNTVWNFDGAFLEDIDYEKEIKTMMKDKDGKKLSDEMLRYVNDIFKQPYKDFEFLIEDDDGTFEHSLRDRE